MSEGYRVFIVTTTDGKSEMLTVSDGQSPQAALDKMFPGGTLGMMVYEATPDPVTGALWSGD